MLFTVWLLVGALVGTIGTLIGAGGGFLLMPVLMFAFRGTSPDILTAWSLTVVLFNSVSGSVAYARSRRIDYRAGLVFALAALPGAWFGARLTAYLSMSWFSPMFGLLLALISGYLLYRSIRQPARVVTTHINLKRNELLLGAVLSLFVGVISSIFGIGGGIIHVPLLVYVIGFPTHIATATSHFVLALTALTGVLTHVTSGSLRYTVLPLVPLVCGVILGAQVGARYSTKLSGPWIIRCLSLGLLAVAVRLLVYR
jgi:uncharacterized membrane protein YfcA